MQSSAPVAPVHASIRAKQYFWDKTLHRSGNSVFIALAQSFLALFRSMFRDFISFSMKVSRARATLPSASSKHFCALSGQPTTGGRPGLLRSIAPLSIASMICSNRSCSAMGSRFGSRASSATDGGPLLRARRKSAEDRRQVRRFQRDRRFYVGSAIPKSSGIGVKNGYELVLAHVGSGSGPMNGSVVANERRKLVLAYAGGEFAKLRPISLFQGNCRFFVSSAKEDAGAERANRRRNPITQLAGWPPQGGEYQTSARRANGTTLSGVASSRRKLGPARKSLGAFMHARAALIDTEHPAARVRQDTDPGRSSRNHARPSARRTHAANVVRGKGLGFPGVALADASSESGQPDGSSHRTACLRSTGRQARRHQRSCGPSRSRELAATTAVRRPHGPSFARPRYECDPGRDRPRTSEGRRPRFFAGA